MAEVVGWRGVFVVMAIASVLILGLIRASAVRPRRSTAAVGAPGPPPQPAATAAPPSVTTPVSTLLRLRAVSVTTLWALAVYGIYTYLGTILTNIAHLTSWLLAAALACFGLGAIAGNLAGGRLTDRWGGRTVSIVSLSALAVLDTVLGLTLDAPTAVLLLVLAAVALAAYPYFSAQQARLIAYQPAGSGIADRLEQQRHVRGHPDRVGRRGQGPDPPGRARARVRGRRRRRPRRPDSHPQHPRTAPHGAAHKNAIRVIRCRLTPQRCRTQSPFAVL